MDATFFNSDQTCSCARSEALDFRPVTPDAMPQIMPYLERQSWRTTDFSYGGLLMWVDVFGYEYCICRDTLFIKGVVEDERSKPAFSMPLGALSVAESIGMLREYCRRRGMPLELSAVPEPALGELRTLNPTSVVELTDWGDYLYDASDLAFLRGKKFGKKRNHVNRFSTLYPDWKLLSLTPERVNDALEMMNLFDLEGDSTPMAVTERLMTRRLLEVIMRGDTPLTGALLMVGSEVAAFTIGDIVGDTLFIHVEKALRRFDGSYEAINSFFAREAILSRPEIKYINREDDSGDKGLRQAKQSYRPIALLKKYNVIF